ncbi:MAG: FAD-binding protein [Candidatus Firestonebacteria bacterium]
MKEKIIKTECAVIGGGFSGCSVALELADAGKKVDLFVKGRFLEDCNSYLTAGGLAAVPLKDGKPVNGDSFPLHVKDTLKAGKYLNDEAVVRYSVEHFFPEVIEWLVEKGVKFDGPSSGCGYDLHKEGGHSKNRVFHVEDATGIAIMNVLVEKIKKHPEIRIHENHTAIDLITKNSVTGKKGRDSIIGLYVLDSSKECVKTISSKGIFLATGGLGKVFLYTSNPDVASGDGFAISYRAGLKLVNMEFIQFHPTVFYDPTAVNESGRRFLLTEALRGAGAILKLTKDAQEDFVLKYDPRGSKSTRDIVTKAEDIEMRKHGLSNVWLDCTKIKTEIIKKDFINSYEFCLTKGIDITKEPVPVVYAEHYSNGGVFVGKNSQTELKGLYVIGETSYTGLHGATRLASNSAPECVLYGKLAAKHFLRRQKSFTAYNVPAWKAGKTHKLKDKTAISYYWDTVRRTMTSLCGVSRNWERLSAAKDVLVALNKNIMKFYWNYSVTKDFLEARNIATVASIIVESALARQESRACHFREDFPKEYEAFNGLTVLRKKHNAVIQKKK